MSLVVNTNIASLQAQANISNNQERLRVSFQRLSSGYRINGAQDDAAGLAISESMNNQVRGYAVAERNSNNAISMSLTAEGALSQVTSLIGRMRAPASQRTSLRQAPQRRAH